MLSLNQFKPARSVGVAVSLIGFVANNSYLNIGILPGEALLHNIRAVNRHSIKVSVHLLSGTNILDGRGPFEIDVESNSDFESGNTKLQVQAEQCLMLVKEIKDAIRTSDSQKFPNKRQPYRLISDTDVIVDHFASQDDSINKIEDDIGISKRFIDEVIAALKSSTDANHNQNLILNLVSSDLVLNPDNLKWVLKKAAYDDDIEHAQEISDKYWRDQSEAASDMDRQREILESLNAAIFGVAEDKYPEKYLVLELLIREYLEKAIGNKWGEYYLKEVLTHFADKGNSEVITKIVEEVRELRIRYSSIKGEIEYSKIENAIRLTDAENLYFFPMTHAARLGQQKVVDLLIEQYEIKDGNTFSATLEQAVRAGQALVADKVLKEFHESDNLRYVYDSRVHVRLGWALSNLAEHDRCNMKLVNKILLFYFESVYRKDLASVISETLPKAAANGHGQMVSTLLDKYLMLRHAEKTHHIDTAVCYQVRPGSSGIEFRRGIDDNRSNEDPESLYVSFVSNELVKGTIKEGWKVISVDGISCSNGSALTFGHLLNKSNTNRSTLISKSDSYRVKFDSEPFFKDAAAKSLSIANEKGHGDIVKLLLGVYVSEYYWSHRPENGYELDNFAPLKLLLSTTQELSSEAVQPWMETCLRFALKKDDLSLSLTQAMVKKIRKAMTKKPEWEDGLKQAIMKIQTQREKDAMSQTQHDVVMFQKLTKLLESYGMI